ncbi:hypothetical protein B566_EDAN002431 [Ephemera danica]|nr:hypothetical protein B566_EDAN002431 [Ephemera danica]
MRCDIKDEISTVLSVMLFFLVLMVLTASVKAEEFPCSTLRPIDTFTQEQFVGTWIEVEGYDFQVQQTSPRNCVTMEIDRIEGRQMQLRINESLPEHECTESEEKSTIIPFQVSMETTGIWNISADTIMFIVAESSDHHLMAIVVCIPPFVGRPVTNVQYNATSKSVMIMRFMKSEPSSAQSLQELRDKVTDLISVDFKLIPARQC